MSRNLCRVDCARCESRVKISGPLYRLPSDHFSQPHLLVADAECSVCAARFTAWIGHTEDRNVRVGDLDMIEANGFYDLSYRANFNDEPEGCDLPRSDEPSRMPTFPLHPAYRLVRGICEAWATDKMAASQSELIVRELASRDMLINAAMRGGPFVLDISKPSTGFCRTANSLATGIEMGSYSQGILDEYRALGRMVPK